MRSLCRTLFCAALVSAAAMAADQTLLSLVMPDAKVVAGAQVDQAKLSPFGVYVMTHLQPDDTDFSNFIAETGFDPRRDVTEVVMASSGVHNDPGHWLILAKGVFTPAKIESAARANGGVVTPYQGVDIISGEPTASNPKPFGNSALGFLDPSTAVIGEISAVKAAIDRRNAHAPVSTTLAAKIAQVSLNNDFWFTTLVPLSEFAGAMPDPNLGSAMKGSLFTAIQQASGGVKFGATVQVSAEAITRSDKDASSLVDVVKFLAGLVQLNRQKDNTAAEVATLLDTLQTSTNGNVMTMTLSIPESTLEGMLDMARQQKHTAHKKPTQAN